MTTPIIEIADKFLLTSGVTSLPLSLEALEGVAKRYGWIIETYTAAREYIAKHSLEDFTKDRDAFTFSIEDQRIIFYNGEAAHQNKIHAICHEMGHIVLRHDLKHIVPIQEWEADVFAEEMISPTCSRARTQLQEELCEQLGIKTRRSYISNLIPIIGCAVLAIALALVLLVPKQQNTTQDDTEGASAHGITTSEATETVYVTLYGEKYHAAGCHYIEGKDNLTELTAGEALREGYEACGYCID